MTHIIINAGLLTVLTKMRLFHLALIGSWVLDQVSLHQNNSIEIKPLYCMHDIVSVFITILLATASDEKVTYREETHDHSERADVKQRDTIFTNLDVYVSPSIKDCEVDYLMYIIYNNIIVLSYHISLI